MGAQWTALDRDHPPGVGKLADKTHRLIYRFNLFFTPLTLTAQVRPGAYGTHPGCSWMAPSGDNNPTTNPADRSVGYARLNARTAWAIWLLFTFTHGVFSFLLLLLLHCCRFIFCRRRRNKQKLHNEHTDHHAHLRQGWKIWIYDSDKCTIGRVLLARNALPFGTIGFWLFFYLLRATDRCKNLFT